MRPAPTFDLSPERAVIEAMVRDILREQLKIEVPSADEDLIQGGLLDSLSLVDLIFHLETEFGVTTALEDLEPANFSSIAAITTYLEARLGGG
jgi:D-alanine--poly(phosphoribitol) ligase subunit 2